MQIRVLFASLTLAALTTSASSAQARNILVIIGDDMGVDKVSAYHRRAASCPRRLGSLLWDL